MWSLDPIGHREWDGMGWWLVPSSQEISKLLLQESAASVENISTSGWVARTSPISRLVHFSIQQAKGEKHLPQFRVPQSIEQTWLIHASLEDLELIKDIICTWLIHWISSANIKNSFNPTIELSQDFGLYKKTLKHFPCPFASTFDPPQKGPIEWCQGRSTPCIRDGHPSINDGNAYNGYLILNPFSCG